MYSVGKQAFQPSAGLTVRLKTFSYISLYTDRIPFEKVLNFSKPEKNNSSKRKKKDKPSDDVKAVFIPAYTQTNFIDKKIQKYKINKKYIKNDKISKNSSKNVLF